jgi:adenylosuccinate lyase
MTTQQSAISIFDGRYRMQCQDLAKYFTEETYTQVRYDIELAWLQTLIAEFYNPSETEMANDKKTVLAMLSKLPQTLTQEHLAGIKTLERITNHDVKAIELFIKAELDKLIGYTPIREWVHMCLTSQDVCSPAQTFMLWNATSSLVSQLGRDVTDFQNRITTDGWDKIPMLAHTHGQPAIPTLLGKELLFHTQRIGLTLDCLATTHLTYKFGGAIGSWASGSFIFPDTTLAEWRRLFDETFREREELGYIIHGNLKFGLPFIENPGLESITRTPIGQTTQTDDYSSYYRLISELCLLMRQIRSFADYIRALIHDEYLVQVPVATETGSSTMPQKVNPIHFENIKANAELANAILRSIGDTIMMGEYQRDMSDSTALRSFSTAFGYIGIVVANLRTGLSRVAPNKEHITSELDQHPEVIMEAIQTVCRRWNIPAAYEMAKEFSRGKSGVITLDAIQKEFISRIPGLPEAERGRLLALTPAAYLGLLSKKP